MASGFTRKNPLAAIEAFKLAFGNDPACRLVIKAANMNLYAEGHRALIAAASSAPNIQLSDNGDLAELYASCDAVISTHRSEGFGLVIAEAMLRGLPVLATDWSGSIDFLTPENGFPISYSLVPAVDPQGTYDQPSLMWAGVNTRDAASKLRALLPTLI